MKTVLVPALVVIGFASMEAVIADEITLSINNMSGKQITAFYATPASDSVASESNLLASGLAASEVAEIVIAAAEPVCVYDLKIAYGDGSGLERPDVDLCQTDELIID